MSKHLKPNEWKYWFKKYEKQLGNNNFWISYLTETKRSTLKNSYSAKNIFRYKYNSWKVLGDNLFMKTKETRGRKPKYFKDKKNSTNKIEEIISNLTREQLEEIAKRYHEINKNKKPNEKVKESKNLIKINISLKSKFFNIDRGNFYKSSVKQRKYKLDIFKNQIHDCFTSNMNAYGRERLSMALKIEYGIEVNPRTLGNYMNRNDLITKTRLAKRRRESKDTNVKIQDFVKRVFNPDKDNIIASDVSYIPANVKQKNIYLSVAISHKTKMIEAWKISDSNNSELVLSTIEQLSRKDFIFHTDHGSQYSSYDVLNKLKTINAKSSMSRVGNSLDNREVEYFFSCLKGEYLSQIKTSKMGMNEIEFHIDKYIEWYNTKRIQKRLHWYTPSSVSQYAI